MFSKHPWMSKLRKIRRPRSKLRKRGNRCTGFTCYECPKATVQSPKPGPQDRGASRPYPYAGPQRQTVTALAHELRNAVGSDPEAYAANVDRLVGLKPIYVRRTLEGLRNAANNGQSLSGTHGQADRTCLPVRPICTLQRAGVSGGIREPFVRHRRRHRSMHPGRLGYAQMASKQISRNLVSYHKSNGFLVSPRRHQRRAMEMPISLSGARSDCGGDYRSICRNHG